MTAVQVTSCKASSYCDLSQVSTQQRMGKMCYKYISAIRYIKHEESI